MATELRDSAAAPDIVADPTLLSDLACEPEVENLTCLETILAEVYPIIQRVRHATTARFKAGENHRTILEDLVRELETLYSVPVDGVSTVYH